MKKEKGITLVALVIIIIVLLILAGITVSLVMGENGIINRGKKASEDYAIAQCKEKIELALQNLSVEQVSKGETLTKEVLPKINSEEISVGEVTAFPVEVVCGKYKYNIDENFVVTYAGEADGTVVTYTTDPVGYTNQAQVKILVKVKNSKGLKTITDPSGDTITVSDGRTEVATDYTVTANGTYKFKVIGANDKETTKNVVIDQIDRLAPKDFTITGENITKTSFTIKAETTDEEATENDTKSGIEKYEYYVNDRKYETNEIQGLELGTEYQVYVIAYDRAGNTKKSNTITVETQEDVEIIWTNDTTSNRTIDGTAPTYRNPIIPVGFSAVNTEDSKWNKENGTQSEWNNGLVIKNVTDGNEFVWIPVDGANVTYTRWCTTNISYSSCTDLAATSGLDIANNVTSYGGFWVARYEAGLPETINQTNIGARNVSGKPLSKAGTVPWNNIDWNNSKANAASMYSNSYVQSGLINGTQWDTIMKWIQNGGMSVTNSNNWGNYNTSSVTLRGGKYAYISTSWGASWTAATQTAVNNIQLIKTGASDTAKAKNVYDLAGNLWEWTCEQCSSNRVYRGGAYTSFAAVSAAAFRNNGNGTYADYSIGFRAQLYIK